MSSHPCPEGEQYPETTPPEIRQKIDKVIKLAEEADAIMDKLLYGDRPALPSSQSQPAPEVTSK